MSPAMAAAAAVTGRLTDVRSLARRSLSMEAFTRLDAVALPLARANVDTDQIVPARYLQKPRSDDFGDYLFRDLRYDARRRASAPTSCSTSAAYRDARILVADRNFGCGSSREHAVWALYDYGFRAAIAPSFGDIFCSNALKNGLLPIVLPRGRRSTRLLDALAAAPGRARRGRPARRRRVTAPDGADARASTSIPSRKHCLLEGLDELDYTLTQLRRDRGLRARRCARDASKGPAR